ncbi:hypothetical protein GCM10018954_047990 [Kutzneria kofuensis]
MAPVAAAAPAVPDAVADPATALKLAHQANKQVLVTSQTTDASETVANPDGSWTLTAHSEPVRMQQNGAWVPLDATLVKRPDGAITPKALPLDIVLNAGGTGSTAAPIVRVGLGDKQAGLTWPTDLPVPQLSGDAATYANVFPDVDLRIEVTTRGYTENMVVKSAAAARSAAIAGVTFGLYTRNTTVSVGDGGMQVKDMTGNVLFTGDASSMWDSSGAGTEAEKVLGPGGGNRHAKMTVSASANAVTIAPDQAFLADPKTKFPVVLDPESSCDSCVAQAHVVVQSGFPTQKNYNQTTQDLSNLKAGYETEDAAAISRSYFEVNTSQLAGAVIHSATVNTTLLHSAACSVSDNDATGLWLSGGITPDTSWARSATSAGQPPLVLGISTSNVTNCHDAPDVLMQFDAKDAANYAVSHGVTTSTFMLASTADVDHGQQDLNSWRRFALNPILQVKYNKPPNTPTNLAMEDGAVPCVQGEGRPWIANPTLSSSVLTDPTAAMCWATSVWTRGPPAMSCRTRTGPNYPNAAFVGSGGTAQVTVPSGVLAKAGKLLVADVGGGRDPSAGASPPVKQRGVSSRRDAIAPPSPTVTMTGTPPSTQGETATFDVSVGLATPGCTTSITSSTRPTVPSRRYRPRRPHRLPRTRAGPVRPRL